MMNLLHAMLDELNAEAAKLAATIRKNFEELGILQKRKSKGWMFMDQYAAAQVWRSQRRNTPTAGWRNLLNSQCGMIFS
jgi:hypothetical protein